MTIPTGMLIASALTEGIILVLLAAAVLGHAIGLLRRLDRVGSLERQPACLPVAARSHLLVRLHDQRQRLVHFASSS